MTSAEQLINERAYATVDNEPGSVAKLQQAAVFFKTIRWPAEYGRSTQALHPATLNRLEKDSRTPRGRGWNLRTQSGVERGSDEQATSCLVFRKRD